MSRRYLVVLMLLLGVHSACRPDQRGSIEGNVSPPASARIKAMHTGGAVAETVADPASGQFKLFLAPGTYDLTITVQSSPLPVVLSGINVDRGRVTQMGTVALAPAPRGAARISGNVRAGSSGARVHLYSEGVERASVSTDAKGRYEFERLGAGTYTLQVHAAGYAKESLQVPVAGEANVSIDLRMIFVALIEGVDYEKGVIRVRGIGLPPPHAPTPSVRREMAKRAALSDAERNLLRVIEMVQVGPGEPLKKALGEKNAMERLHGFLRGYTITADRDLDGGRVEIELQVPITGAGGLSSYLGSF